MELIMVRPTNINSLGGSRSKVSRLVEKPRFIGLITALILFNALTLGLETNAAIIANYGGFLYAVDFILLLVFTLEIGLKLFAYRSSFFRSGWNLFDFIIVAMAWLPVSGPFVILRAFRILRVLRLLSVAPQLRRVISAVGKSIPGMLSVIGVLCLIFYISAVLTTKLFGQHPDPRLQEWFGSIGSSAYTLFQIMTLESWSMGIVRPTMELFPYAWLFFVPFIVVTSFAVLNLFIGIIVDAMQSAHEEPSEQGRGKIVEFNHSEFMMLHQGLDEVKRELTVLSKSLNQEKNE